MADRRTADERPRAAPADDASGGDGKRGRGRAADHPWHHRDPLRGDDDGPAQVDQARSTDAGSGSGATISASAGTSSNSPTSSGAPINRGVMSMVSTSRNSSEAVTPLSFSLRAVTSTRVSRVPMAPL